MPLSCLLGRTGYTMSMTNTTDPRKYMYYALWDWPRVENPKVAFLYSFSLHIVSFVVGALPARGR